MDEPPDLALLQVAALSSPGLAAELVLHIFSFLENDVFTSRADVVSVLLACCRVSYAWSRCARLRIYRRVELRTSRSALRFMNTLTNGRVGALVHSVEFWTDVYTQLSAVGRNGLLRASWKRGEMLRGDRFLDSVIRHCPNISSLAVQNRTGAPERDVVLARPANFSPNLLNHVTCLDLDASSYTSRQPSGHWLIGALYGGKLALPSLEELRVRCKHNYNMPSGRTWSSFPSLRRLFVTDISLSLTNNRPAFQALLAAAPSLEDLRLCRITSPSEEQIFRLYLPSTTCLKQIVIQDSVFPIVQIASFVLPAADTLEELRISTTRLTDDLPQWPKFKRLARLHLAWESIFESTIALLMSVLPQLHELAMRPSASLVEMDAHELTTAGTSVLSALERSKNLGLETLGLEGNAFVDVGLLSAVIDSMPRLTTLRIGTTLPELPVFLSHISPRLRTLEMRLDGRGPNTRDVLLNILPAALPHLVCVERLQVLDDAFQGEQGPQWRDLDRRKVIPQFLSVCKSLGGPTVSIYVENHNEAWSWTAPTDWETPVEISPMLVSRMVTASNRVDDVLVHFIQERRWPFRYILQAVFSLLFVPMAMVWNVLHIGILILEDPYRGFAYLGATLTFFGLGGGITFFVRFICSE